MLYLNQGRCPVRDFHLHLQIFEVLYSRKIYRTILKAVITSKATRNHYSSNPTLPLTLHYKHTDLPLTFCLVPYSRRKIWQLGTHKQNAISALELKHL